MVDLNPNQLHFDGVSRGNPWFAGAGAVVKHGKDVYELGQFLPSATNAEAECAALILGLKKALELGIDQLAIYSDSTLIINELDEEEEGNKLYQTPLWQEALNLLEQFTTVTLNHVKPKKNRHADWLANQVLKTREDFERKDNQYNKNKQQQQNQKQQQKKQNKSKSKK